MYVSAEILTIVISFATLLVAIAGGFGWMIQHTDAQLASLRNDLGTRIDAQTRELIEVKIAVARLEGPTPRLITTR